MDPFSIESIETPSAAWEQFSSEVGKKSLQLYKAKHGITEPPKNPVEAMSMAKEAVDEYIDSI